MTSKVFTQGTVIDSEWLNDVNNATYSGNAVYAPAGTGAVATTVQSKLRESVSVKDFGAVGDGVTDDTTAIQAAIDYIEAITPFGSVPTETGRCKNRPAIYIPAGTYRLDGTLQITQTGMKFYGDGPINSVLMRGTTADTVVLEMGTFVPDGDVFTNGPQDCSISDIGIFNDNWGYPHTSSVGMGIRLSGCGGLRLDRVNVMGFAVGINSPYGGDYNQFNDVVVGTCVIGIYQGPGGQQTEINKAQVNSCKYGIVLDRPGHITINSPILNGCSEYCILLEAPSDTTTRYLTSIGGGGSVYMTGQIVINEPWFESGAGGYEPCATHYIYCDNLTSDSYRNVTINNPFIVSGISSLTPAKNATSFVANAAVGNGMRRVFINNPSMAGLMDYWTYNAISPWELNTPYTVAGYGIPKYGNNTETQVKDALGRTIKGTLSNSSVSYQDNAGGNGVTISQTTSRDKIRYAFNNVYCEFVGSITSNVLTVTSVVSGSLGIGNTIQTNGLEGFLTITAGSGSTWTVPSSNNISSRTFYAFIPIYRFGFDIQNRRLFLGDPEANEFSISRGAMPTSGTYAIGSFVYNTSPSVAGGKTLLGWQRLTTGSGHVLNTDWSPCYVTNT